MTPVASTNLPNGITGNASSVAANSGFSALGHGDFLRLMVEQLKQQDPFDPVDNKEMLAQMAQFSSLAGATEGNASLADISEKLDTLIALQTQAAAAVRVRPVNLQSPLPTIPER